MTKMQNSKEKSDESTCEVTLAISGAESSRTTSRTYSAAEVSKTWESFAPKVPLTFLVAARNAVKEKNS